MIKQEGVNRPSHWPLLCWLGIHSGEWSLVSKGPCFQSRECTVCGLRQTRTKHAWDTGWQGNGEIRTCVRCGKTESRGRTREELCVGLRALGLSADLARRGRPEEKTGEDSIGLVDISESPIHWANVRKWNNEGWVYATDYGVPDARGVPTTVVLRSVRKRNTPVFGQVTRVVWQGKEYGTGVAERLGTDQALEAAIISARAEIRVCTSAEDKCWLIPHASKDAPSAELWRCYEMVARNLLRK